MAGERMLTVKDVAAMTTLAQSTLFDWRSQGKGPRSFKFGSRVVYLESDVHAWIAEQQKTTGRGGSA